MGTNLLALMSGNWLMPVLLAALVLVAALVNRFAPNRRKHLRRAVFVFVLYAVFALALRVAPAGGWHNRFFFFEQLFASFTVVALIGLFVFDVTLRVLRVAIAQIISDLLVGLAYIVTTIAVIDSTGHDLSSVIATSAVVSGILAISLQATLGNILGGVALQLDGSIHVGDWVQLDNGRQGKVKQIRWRHTILETRDWATIVVPNSSLLASNIMILGKREGQPHQQRMWVHFHVDFRYAPQRVVQVVEDALCAAPIANVAAEPRANCICLDFARDGRESYALYAVRYYLTDLAVDDPTSSAVRTRIFAALRRADIPLARPAHSVFVTNQDDDYARRRDIRHREQREKAVEEMDLFKSLTTEERATIASRLIYAPFTAGEVATRQGAVAHWLYIITHGSVEIRLKTQDGAVKKVARLDAPSFFGEMGLMTGEPRLADVVALTDVECYRLDKESFEKIVHDRPEVAEEMSKMLARRRIELLAVRDENDADRNARLTMEQDAILGKIRDFFGLSS